MQASARYANLQLVNLLIKSGANLNSRSKWGETALQIAAQGAEWGVFKALCEANADVTLADNGGCTALHWVAQGKYEEGIISLIERNANVNAMNSRGEVPLSMLISSTIRDPNISLRCLKRLLAAGADRSLAEKESGKILNWLLEQGVSKKDVYKFLMERIAELSNNVIKSLNHAIESLNDEVKHASENLKDDPENLHQHLLALSKKMNILAEVILPNTLKLMAEKLPEEKKKEKITSVFNSSSAFMNDNKKISNSQPSQEALSFQQLYSVLMPFSEFKKITEEIKNKSPDNNKEVVRNSLAKSLSEIQKILVLKQISLNCTDKQDDETNKKIKQALAEVARHKELLKDEDCILEAFKI